MSFPSQFTAIAPTTGATATGTADMGAIANKFAVQLVVNGGTGNPTISVFASCDGQNFSKVEPTFAPLNAGWYAYQTPAQQVKVQMGGNAGGKVAVYVVGQSD